ncbi:hypothetical protein CSHOW_1681 [Campylobacter showae]|nr:hypothetical protein CSHOW_1681 [Campylobacter showae]
MHILAFVLKSGLILTARGLGFVKAVIIAVISVAVKPFCADGSDIYLSARRSFFALKNALNFSA